MLKEIAYTLYSILLHTSANSSYCLGCSTCLLFGCLSRDLPLWKVPGPYIHRISYIPCYNAQRNGTWIARVHELHKKYGSVVLLSPNEVSVNGDPKFINDIYVKNFPKSKFYENFRNHGFKDNILPVWRTIVIASIRS